MTSKARPAKRGAEPKIHAVVFGETTIEYQVRRSRRRKKTVSIRVDGSGVHVAAPMRTPNRALQEMVLKRASWILERMSHIEENALPRRFVSGEAFPYLGRTLKLIVEPGAVRGTQVRFDRWRLRVTVPNRLDEAKRKDAVRRVVVEWYKARAAERLAACVERWWPVLGLGEMSRIFVRDPRRQWGSCAPDGTLRFSWRLVMLAPALLEYVVVHELAHLTHRNHSANFWGLVSKVLPDAQQRRKRLAELPLTLPLI